jgi:hypothetical protein
VRGRVVDELDGYRGRIEVQPQAVLVVAEISESADGHHRHIPLAAWVAAAAGAGVEQQVGASPGAGVAGLGNETQDDIGFVGVLHGDQQAGGAAVGARLRGDEPAEDARPLTGRRA